MIRVGEDSPAKCSRAQESDAGAAYVLSRALARSYAAGSFIIAASFGHLGVDCSLFPVVYRKKNTAG